MSQAQAHDQSAIGTPEVADPTCGVVVRRTGARATVYVHGPCTGSAQQDLHHVLDWLLDTGTDQVRIELDHPQPTPHVRPVTDRREMRCGWRAIRSGWWE